MQIAFQRFLVFSCCRFGEHLKVSLITQNLVLHRHADAPLNQMFLLVSSRHALTASGVSIKISINLGKNFPHISCLTKIFCYLNLGERLSISLLSFSQILDFIYWTVLMFVILNGVTLKTSNLYHGSSLCHDMYRIVRNCIVAALGKFVFSGNSIWVIAVY